MEESTGQRVQDGECMPANKSLLPVAKSTFFRCLIAHFHEEIFTGLNLL
jgi:hypothetical protein